MTAKVSDAREPSAPSFVDLPDLAAERFGGEVVAANDDFFAPKESLIKPGAPVWREGEYTDRGKWMDGWETRRRRTPGHDWAIIQLGLPGIIRGVVIDTSFFTGNYPELASIDACAVEGNPPGERMTKDDIPWTPILGKTVLKGDASNEISVTPHDRRATHLRLNIFPDGGVARLRVHGEVAPDERLFESGDEIDLAATASGGVVVSCSDMHYGNPQNMMLPGRSTHMGDGWETKRRRGPGNDWAIIRLARRGIVERVELDTDHFKGNAPGSCSLEYADAPEPLDPGSAQWKPLVPESPLKPHDRHRWTTAAAEPATHVRLNIYPDGGVARLRLFGRATK